MPENPYQPPKEVEPTKPVQVEWFAVQQVALVLVSAWLAWLVWDSVFLAMVFRSKGEIASLTGFAAGVATFVVLWHVLWKLLETFVGRKRT